MKPALTLGPDGLMAQNPHHGVLRLLLTAILLATAAAHTAPIQLHPDNPHYFLWRGKPAILITAGEHYGAVMNLDFDYVRYFEEQKAHRFNLTRAFSGTYRELPDSFNIKGNTLAPTPKRFVCPWARSRSGPEDRFDLTQYDATYFSRLKTFVGEASRRGIVVELVLFCTMYDEALWNASPMNPRNNINNLGAIPRTEVYAAKNERLLEAQKAVVRKLVRELNAFDNLYFEICNEPYERGGLTKEWNDYMIAAVVQAEADLPNQHLIAQGFPPGTAIKDLNSNVSILNFHGTSPHDVRASYHLNKVVAFDETGGSDRSDRKYRTEGWDFILAGGGVYDHLDFSFTPDREDGTAVPLPSPTPGGGGPALRSQLAILKDFIEGFAFTRMKPSDAIIMEKKITDPRNKATARALAEVGKAYAIYVNGGTQAELTLELPGGRYKADWVNPKNGKADKSETFNHPGGTRSFVSPAYADDIALRVTQGGK